MEFINSTGKGMDGGFFEIEDADGNTVFSSIPGTNDFKYALNVDLYSSTVVAVEDVICKDVNVYPNPATSVINVSYSNMKTVSVYNAIGQLIYTENAETDDVIIDTDSWTNGMYYVNVELLDGSKSSQKIIVNR